MYVYRRASSTLQGGYLNAQQQILSVVAAAKVHPVEVSFIAGGYTTPVLHAAGPGSTFVAARVYTCFQQSHALIAHDKMG